MQNPINILMPIYFVSLAIAFVVYLLYKKRLRELYPDLAATLYPDMIPRNPFENFKSGGNSRWFILRREYRSLDNRGFVRLCDCYRILLLWSYFMFFVVILVFAFSSVKT
jgi:hypothetical protein